VLEEADTAEEPGMELVRPWRHHDDLVYKSDGYRGFRLVLLSPPPSELSRLSNYK
jgi:hypothetical protein